MLDNLTAQLPTTPIDLSSRIRELRSNQGLKQSDIARRMGLDPSIPSLWEQGKRPVPANRIPSLADALGVTVSDLLEGTADQPRLSGSADVPRHRDLLDMDFPAFSRSLGDSVVRSAAPLMTLVSTPIAPLAVAPVTRVLEQQPSETVAPPEPKPWVVAPRPVLSGWIPEGWEPSDRVKDISPSLPDGFWLDPVWLEKPAAKARLRLALCEQDRGVVLDRDVPGAALAERIYRHCSHEPSYQARAPLMETIFRLVVAADEGGLTVSRIIEPLQDRAGAVPVTRKLLRRLRGSVHPYPMVWVDRELFKGYC